MNLRQPYEQLIADKLRQLKAPDADASWQQMKRLLDDNDDAGAGGRNRPPGNSGWWRIGILAIVLSASFWLYIDSKSSTPPASLSKTNATVPSTNDGTGNTVKPNKNQTTAIDNNITLKEEHTNNTAEKNETSSVADKSIATVIKKEADKNIAENSSASSNKKNNDGLASETSNKTVNDVAVKNSTYKKAYSNIAYSNKKQGANVSGNNNNTALNIAANTSNGIPLQSSAQKNKPGYKNGKRSGHNTIANYDADDASNNNINSSLTTNAVAPFNEPATAKQKEWLERLTGLKTQQPIPTYNTSLAEANNDISKTPDENNMLNSETKKAVAKAQRENEIALMDKKDKKSLHLNLSNVFKPFSMRIDADPWWAAGLSLSTNIPVHAQNRFNYNMNAKSGASMLSDYIPSPYLQFHLNNYVYLQTELNFVSPQLTPQLLAYRQSSEISAQQGISQEKSIYIQKMYYFNWPVSLHYSPINNLFLSAGIQFSSFQSGLASIQEKQYVTLSGPDHASSVTTDLLKFKDDSIAAKIAPNEWRWQLGAEYYINRFSVGVRYNQSFKNAVNTTVSSSLPPTVYRNESLLFFVRYNIFESRNKNTVPKNQ